jgi:diguanylate cyclase (GGDEF)-like protein
MNDLTAHSVIALDLSTLFVVATCVSGFLGLFLLCAWMQDRVRALAWWGSAYLIGGLSVAIWSIDGQVSPILPTGFANALLFISCGMIWNAARLFHGRPVLWGALVAGAAIWLIACAQPFFQDSVAARIVLSCLIVATYTFLTSAELWRERRRQHLRRWPAIFVPTLHGLVFLSPIPLSALLPSDGGVVSLATGWIAVFVIEVMLYVVGTAFIGLTLAKERVVRIHEDAASTDELTGLLNRRGFLHAAQAMIEQRQRRGEPVSVLMFDLDHFKAINDRYGHNVGDQALRLFGTTASSTLRASDVIGRLGGEEFVAILPGVMEDAAIAAERVRIAFEMAGVAIAGCLIDATVSIGVAGGTDIETMLADADAALYRAKANGRNRVEMADDITPVAAPVPVAAERGYDRRLPELQPAS